MMVKLALRGLVAHKARLALSALAVVTGVAFVAGTLIFATTLDRSFDRAFADLGRGTDTVVRTKRAFDGGLGERSAERPVPASVLASVRRTPGVAKAHGVVSGFAAVIDAKGKVVGPEPQTGVDWYGDPDLSLMRLTTGRGPSAPDEVAIDSTTATASGHRIGDRVKVATHAGTQAFTLTGVFAYGDSALSATVTVTAFAPGAAQRLLMDRPGTYTRVEAHAAPGVSQERLRDAVAASLPAGVEAVTGRQATAELAEPLKDIIKVMRTFLLVFAVIAVFVGSFIIFNTFTMLVAQRTRELALLRAVGASRGQVTRSVMAEAAGVGVVGSTLGLAAGAGLALGLSRLMSMLAGESLPFGTLALPASAVAAAYGVGLPVTLAAAYIPARRAARTPPVAALREHATSRSLRGRAITGGIAAVAGAAAMLASPAASGRPALYLAGGGGMVFFVGLATLSPVLSRPVLGLLGRPIARFGGAPGRMGRRNAQRNPRQTAATASALMIGLALIGTVTVLTASMGASVDRQLEQGLTADYRVTGRSQITPVGPEVLPAVARVPGVRAAVAVRTARVRLGGRVQAVTVGNPPELAAHLRLAVTSGTAATTADALLISSDTARSNGWAVGGAVPGEQQDGTRTAFRVTGVYTAAPTVPAVIIGTAAAPTAPLDRVELTGTPSRTALEAALARWPNLDLKDREEIKADAAGDIDLFLQLILALLVLSVLIAALGIVNTLALAVIERTREIGLLRAVGMQRRQLRRMIRYEAVLISVYGAVLGLGTGLLLGVAVQGALASEEGMDVLAVPYRRLALYVLAAALVGVAAAAWPAHRAARMNALTAIASD